MGLIESASSGDRLKALEDLRDVLALNIDSCESARDLSSLSARLQSVLEEISTLNKHTGAGDGIDEIAERRAARRASPTKGSIRAGS